MYPPMGARPPPGVLDKGAYCHICSHIGRLCIFDKFTVAVVDHYYQVIPDGADEFYALSYLLYGEAPPVRISL